MEIEFSAQLTKIKQRILKLLEQFLNKVEEGDMQYLPFTKACTHMTSKLNESNTLSTNNINTVTGIITDMNKALHPEDNRGQLQTLSESIERALEELE